MAPNPEATGPIARAGSATDVADAFWLDLWSRAFPRAAGRMDATMAASLPAERLSIAWSSLERRVGKPLHYRTLDVVYGQSRTHSWYECHFERAIWHAEVVVDEDRRVSGLRLVPAPPTWSAPPYVDPTSFTERFVSVGSPPLRGVLSVPHRSVQQAVVLVHGSGPQDEDASAGPGGTGSKIFKDLAWGLASRGIAVLRYPKRSWAQPERFEGVAFTLDDEVTEDACAAVAAARRALSAPDTDIFVVGHSLGAALTPRIAARCPLVSGLVLMAGPSRTLDEVLFDQLRYLLPLAGKNQTDVAAGLGELMAGFAIASLPTDLADDELVFSEMRGSKGYWADVDSYDPVSALARSPRRPMLVLQGGRDYKVTLEDFAGWKKSLRGQSRASFRLYPSLDHYFIRGQGLPMPADDGLGEHVDGQVVTDMAKWIGTTFECAPARERGIVTAPRWVSRWNRRQGTPR